MASCVGNIAGSIQLNCASPLEGGYTGRGIYIPMEAVPVLTKDANNPRIVSAIALATGAKGVLIDNEGSNPFEGSSTTGNNDAGRPRFVKVLSMRMPERGAGFSKDVLEPLVKSGRGGIIILEKVDRVGDGSFEMIGTQSPAKVVDPSTVVRNESENGGAWTASMQSTEDYAEVVFFDTDYATTLTKFEALLANVF